jgi:replicative DNA helicase
MSKEQVARRLLSIICRIPLRRLITGRLNEDDYGKLAEGQKTIAAANLYIVDKTVTISDVERISHEQHAVNPVGLVVLDYLQLLPFAVSKNRTEESFLHDAGLRMKRLAKDLNCVTIALTQLAKDGSASRSMALKNHANIYLKIRWDEDKDKRYVKIDKQRDGETGEVEVGWHGPCATIF